MTIFNVFTLMGGIAMFLYGMDLMGKALEQTAGSKLQGILSTMTSSPIRGLLLGMAVTAVIQSSGATTVMAVGFVNSGLMELHQAISVIMGANVGTTVTGWLLSLSGLEGDSFLTQMMNPTAWSPILGFIGIWMYMIGKDRKRGVGKIRGELHAALREDKNVDRSIFSETFREEDLIEHILDTITISIINGKPDCATLTEILDRLLYR